MLSWVAYMESCATVNTLLMVTTHIYRQLDHDNERLPFTELNNM